MPRAQKRKAKNNPADSVLHELIAIALWLIVLLLAIGLLYVLAKWMPVTFVSIVVSLIIAVIAAA